ncbi:MAG: HAD family phosphatase [Pseudomonadota bacterium]
MNIVFDIGNVLVKWNIYRAFDHVIDDMVEIDKLLERTGFNAWNLEQDRGRSIEGAFAALEAKSPEDVIYFKDYFERFKLTVAEPIQGTWDILHALKARDSRLFAITNWGAVTWPDALELYPELGTIFEDVVVSGHEKLIKPDPAIFQVLIDRNGLNPEDCFFIDDSPQNVAAARALGWQAHLFQHPVALKDDLTARGLL